MKKLQFEFKSVAAADGKSNTIIITSITKQDNRMFSLANEDQSTKKHTLITATTNFAKLNDTFLEETDEINKIATEEDNPMVKLLKKLIENTRNPKKKVWKK
ncbi:hypothetical protein CBL_08378 [Carabus blaptoides fortunei]